LDSKKKVSLWQPKEKKQEIKKGIWNETYLKNLHNTLKLFRYKHLTKRKCVKKLALEDYSNAKTLEYSKNCENDHTVRFQKIIKGRSIQKMMEKGIQNFKVEIEKTKHEFSQFITGQKSISLELKQIEECLKNDLELQKDLKSDESKQTGSYILSLEKELQRLQREKRAHALFILAERERYFREASKYVDEHKLEEMFKKDDIALYLENILIEGVSSENVKTSREYIRDLIRKIDQIATLDHSKGIIKAEAFDDVMDPNNIEKTNNEYFRSKQERILKEIQADIFREEFQVRELEEQRKFCNKIVHELIEKIFTPQNPLIVSQKSLEAEELASEIVKKILDEISSSQNDLIDEYKSVSSLNETDETESSTERKTELLVDQVIYNVLVDVLDEKSTSSDY
jgi:hypothetical protein